MRKRIRFPPENEHELRADQFFQSRITKGEPQVTELTLSVLGGAVKDCTSGCALDCRSDHGQSRGSRGKEVPDGPGGAGSGTLSEDVGRLALWASQEMIVSREMPEGPGRTASNEL